MSDESTEFRLVVENSLLSHVQGEIERLELDFDARAALHHYLTAILNNCPYPIAADTGADGEIRLRYNPRSFSEPFFS